MVKGERKFTEEPQHVVLVGIGLAAFYWTLDAAIDSIQYGGVRFFDTFFTPRPHDLWARLLFFGFLALFIFYVNLIIGKRDLLAKALNVATLKAEEVSRFLQKLIDTIPSPIFYKDADYRFMGCNAAFEECIGLAREQVIGKSFHEILSGEQADAYHLKDQELISNPGVQVYEAEIPCATGCRRDVVFYKATITGTDGVPAGIVGAVMDITERKHAEEQIRSLNKALAFRAAEFAAANRELEAFSYSVSHDLRSPLTRIYSASQLLKEMSFAMLDETGRTLVQTICDGCNDMEELIEALLALSRVTSSKMNRTECNLSKLAEIIAAELQVTEPERNLEFAIEPGLVDDGDPRLIRALLENLLANAWKYSRKTSEARIAFGAADIDGERVYFVRDNGAGFDMGKSDRLFKPFQRLHDNGEFKGTGIGLATVRRIVERHGGRVWGEGEVGRGATFYFTLK